jgi:hypothetical protein
MEERLKCRKRQKAAPGPLVECLGVRLETSSQQSIYVKNITIDA